MNTLKIRVDVKDLFQGPKQFGVIANIYTVPTKERKETLSSEKRKELQNIIIPAGPWEPHPDFYAVSLPEGRYSVVATLPSDETITKEVSLSAANSPLELRLEASDSPHEWLSWQTFSGMVAPVQRYGERVEAVLKSVTLGPETMLVSTGSPPPGDDPAATQELNTAWLSQGYFCANPDLAGSLSSTQVTTFPGWLEMDPPARISSPLTSYSSDPISEVYHFDMDRVVSEIGAPDFGYHYDQARVSRYYLLTLGEGFPAQYSVLPLPWRTPDFSGEQSMVEAYVLQSGLEQGGRDGLDQGFRISTIVQDPMIGSLIAYLGAGHLKAADTIIQNARDMLFEKMANPLAAAAGAYVMVSNLGSERPVYWHDWIHNLMNWFPWLPDGAILYGRVLLGQSRDADTLKQARECFLEGFRRGLPFYSKGIGFLLNGLTGFANDARKDAGVDEPVEAALNIVRDLALRTNVRQPFTCVQLD